VATLEQHFTYLRLISDEARAAPLSIRKARLAFTLTDAAIDRLFEAGGTGDEDVLAHRRRLTASSPALALCAAIADGALRLEVKTVAVSRDDYSRLSEAEYMVSLYNDTTVPRLVVIAPDGTGHEALIILDGALKALGITR
jgi:hypothetical protein